MNKLTPYIDEDNMFGGKFECQPKNKFSEICIEVGDDISITTPSTQTSNIKNKLPTTNYKSKESCVNDCEGKYINEQLNQINIRHETSKFYLFIKDIIKSEQIDVYVKGGNVIGLKILKMIYDKYKNDDKKFKQCFDKFLELDLIKDWDFASYTKKTIDDEYRTHLDKVAKKYQLVPRAKTFILYQTSKPQLLDDKALFEISISDSDAYSKLEIPLTTMKIKVNEYNLKYIFMFAKSFFSYKLKNEPFDFDIMKRMLGKINIIIHPHEKGLYDATKNFDKGSINSTLIEFINNYGKENRHLPQFLVTHLIDTFRMLYRLPQKNIPKTEKIKKFIKDELNVSSQTWLMDTVYIEKMVNKFIKELSVKIVEVYQKNKSVNDVIRFMDGVGFGRSQIDYELYSDKSKQMLKILFEKLVNEIGKDNINGMDGKDKLIKFLKFLMSKKLFD